MQNQFHSSSRNSNQPTSQHQTAEQQTLGRSLQTLFKAASKFMVHRPQASGKPPNVRPQQRYSNRARLYPYLPTSEEQRDWLDRTY